MNEVLNPFGINNYLGPDFFCDRVNETATLLQNIENHNHTAFFALRRMGKTALIQHVSYLLNTKKKAKCIYIDIYATENLKDLTNLLANNIYKLFPQTTSIGKQFWETIKLLRPIVSIDPISGSPELSFDITKPKQFEKTIPQLFQFLDSQGINIVIAIDEFQQILNYPEKNVEALLRTTMQPLQHVTFIFCGSNQAMMLQIFNSVKRPFYASCNTINLQRIDALMYKQFIKKTFAKFKYKITDEAIEEILNYTQIHTYYTQRMCNILFALKEKNITVNTVQKIKEQLFKNEQGVYFQYRNLLTPTQWHLLKALAKEEMVLQPYNKKFISTYQLGTAAIVKRSLEALIQKEMVYRNTSIEQPYYAVYDKFLLRWLQFS
jgi:AAA+ ATPase superfamily predicted ATPase